VLDARGRLLRAALGFVALRPAPRHPALDALHQYLDSWHGVGAVAAGMQRQGWDLQLTAYGDGHWRATFYVIGMAHSIVGGSAWEPAPWRSVLKEAFIAATGHQQYAVPEVDFEAVKDDLREAVRTVLHQHGWSEPQRATAYKNLPALNRLPFRDHVTALCSNLGLNLSEGDVKLFVRCRDSLVHRGRSYTETADEKQRRSVAPHPTKVKEYFWLVHMLDSLFLRIVDTKQMAKALSRLELARTAPAATASVIPLAQAVGKKK
jgi:hypothetical protein